LNLKHEIGSKNSFIKTMLSQQWITTPPYVRYLAHFTHPTRFRTYGASIAGWGVAVGIIAIHFLEVTPIMRRDIMQRIPIVGRYWTKKLELRERAD
jgi:hypothetical protein